MLHLRRVILRTHLPCCEKLKTHRQTHTYSGHWSQLSPALEDYQPGHQTCEERRLRWFPSPWGLPEAQIPRRYKPSLLGPVWIIHSWNLWAQENDSCFTTLSLRWSLQSNGWPDSIPGSEPRTWCESEPEWGLAELGWNEIKDCICSSKIGFCLQREVC